MLAYFERKDIHTRSMMDSNDNNHLQSQFISLIQHSTSLLHRLDKNLDWSYIITAGNGEETELSSSTQTINGNAVLDNNNQHENVDDDDSSSDEDDMMMMLGGYSDSEDDESPSSKSNRNNTSNSDEDVVVIVEEDDAEYTLLKRASVVHSALLLSLPPPTKTSTTSTADVRKIVEQLISAILSGKSSKSTSTTTSSSSNEDKLVSTLSYFISSSSSSSTDNKQPIKTISAQRWKNICLTNSLLVVQFLLHLMKQQNQSNTTTATTSVLDEWNGIILPLLFGNNSFESSSSLFILNDALRDTLLNLSSFTTSSSPCSIDQCQTTVDMCLSTLKQHVTSSTKEEQVGSSSIRRQRYIIMVVCHVLIRLYDGIMSSSSSFQFKKDNEGGGVNNDKMLLDVVRYGMHQTVLLILRGICYYEAEGGGGKPMLSLESLRPITGMLLPKLYPNDDESSGGEGKGKSDVIVADERAVELWNEILLLLQPYSEDTQDDGKRRRCCQNWYVLC